MDIFQPQLISQGIEKFAIRMSTSPASPAVHTLLCNWCCFYPCCMSRFFAFRRDITQHRMQDIHHLKPSALSSRPAAGFAFSALVCVSFRGLGPRSCWNCAVCRAHDLPDWACLQFKSNFLCAVNKLCKRHSAWHTKKCPVTASRGGGRGRCRI